MLKVILQSKDKSPLQSWPKNDFFVVLKDMSASLAQVSPNRRGSDLILIIN